MVAKYPLAGIKEMPEDAIQQMSFTPQILIKAPEK